MSYRQRLKLCFCDLVHQCLAQLWHSCIFDSGRSTLQTGSNFIQVTVGIYGVEPPKIPKAKNCLAKHRTSACIVWRSDDYWYIWNDPGKLWCFASNFDPGWCFFWAGLKWDKSPFVAHEILHPGGVQSRAFRDFLFLGRGLAIGRHGFSPERWAREFSAPETLRYGQKISENDL